jgi:SAM-dependent methyltransferase
MRNAQLPDVLLPVIERPLPLPRLDRSADAAAWSAIVSAAAARYRSVDGHAHRFARSKLRRDAFFRTLLARGLIPPGAQVLDLGCGQGLLAALLKEASCAEEEGRWPAKWPPAPAGARVTGVDLLATDIARARAALGEVAEFVHGDMRLPPELPYDVVVFLDSLHYVTPADQIALLDRARARLRAGGTMLLRVHDDDAPLRAAFGRWVDRCTGALHGGGFGRVHCRPVADWCARLEDLGLRTTTHRVDGRVPFANRLIVASSRTSAPRTPR